MFNGAERRGGFFFSGAGKYGSIGDGGIFVQKLTVVIAGWGDTSRGVRAPLIDTLLKILHGLMDVLWAVRHNLYE